MVKNLLTRVEIREYLLNPPEPPFTIAIAESGQKHIIPWALEAQSQNIFPIQFELDTVYIDDRFRQMLTVYEKLLALGFSKSEIDTGDYRSDRLCKCLNIWWELEQIIQSIRGTRLMELINYVAIVVIEQIPQQAAEEMPQEAPLITSKPTQLSLF